MEISKKEILEKLKGKAFDIISEIADGLNLEVYAIVTCKQRTAQRDNEAGN